MKTTKPEVLGRTTNPVVMTEAAMDNILKSEVKLEFASKRQREAIIRQWEARSCSHNLYYYLFTSTTNRVRAYCEFRDNLIKAKNLNILAFDALAVLLKEADKEMKWRACYTVVPGSIYNFKYIRL